MTLTTQRLTLRMLSKEDASSYLELSQNEGVRRFQISDYRKNSVEDASAWISEIENYHRRNGFGILGVFENESKTLIGLAALKYLDEEGRSPVEMMYRFSDKYWGRGFGSEVAEELKVWGSQVVKLQSLVATVDPENIPSKKILCKLGFKFEKLIQIQNITEELYILSLKNPNETI